MSVERLREIAELYFCENCYRKYMALIEPTVKRWLTMPFADWAEIESYVTQMVMKLEGVFKDKDTILISIDDDEKLSEDLSNKVDVDAFRKIKKWQFGKKMDYLHEHGVLGESSFNLLDRLRQIRNKIHDPDHQFTEQELSLFPQAIGITYSINQAVIFPPK
jgi:hypothetical protein